jgi:hypothetical protein
MFKPSPVFSFVDQQSSVTDQRLLRGACAIRIARAGRIAATLGIRPESCRSRTATFGRRQRYQRSVSVLLDLEVSLRATTSCEFTVLATFDDTATEM